MGGLAWRTGRSATPPLIARRTSAIAGAIRNPAAINLAAPANQRFQKPEGIHESAVRAHVESVLRFSRHSGTPKRNQRVTSKLSRQPEGLTAVPHH
jgi:hypothetical protein